MVKVFNIFVIVVFLGLDLNGMVVFVVCDIIIEWMCDYFGVIVFEDGKVVILNGILIFVEVVKVCYEVWVSLLVMGFYKILDFSWDCKIGLGCLFFYFVYGVVISEVVIDILIGENCILCVDILYDVGKFLNFVLDIG